MEGLLDYSSIYYLWMDFLKAFILVLVAILHVKNSKTSQRMVVSTKEPKHIKSIINDNWETSFWYFSILDCSVSFYTEIRSNTIRERI